jgi:cytosine/adenosine deaminase-related metal-dependent hydrolase
MDSVVNNVSLSRFSSIHGLRNVWLCKLDGEAVRPEFCDLIVTNGKIGEIRPVDHRRYLSSLKRRATPSLSSAESSGEVIDAQGRTATPPMVNFHEHFYSRLAKGLALPGPMNDFRNILKSFWWQLDQMLDADMVAACARLGVVESIRNGVTYVFDHHSSPKFIRGSLDTLARVVSEAGLRGVLCLETSDRSGRRITEASFEEHRQFIGQSVNRNIRGLVGLHAPFTLTDQTLSKAASLCNELNTGIHIHLAEDRYEQQYSRDTFGCTAAMRLQGFGLFDQPGILAHGVHLEPGDWQVLSEGQCALAVNPDSNLNNSVGLGRFTEIPGSISVLAGTDGMHASTARSMKQLFLLHRHQGGEMTESFRFIRKIYFDQVRFARRFFPDYPDLKIGDPADLVIWDYQPPSPFSADTYWGHLIYGLLESPAWTVLMRGKPLLVDHTLRSVDSESTSRSAAVQGARLFEKLGVTHHG